MVTRSDKSRDTAGRMAGWFFFVIGGVLVAFAVAFRSQSELAAWSVGVLGVATIVFGLVAPRELRVSVIEAILILFMSLG
jgi:hypothetical protein